jgi:hypothetical protein
LLYFKNTDQGFSCITGTSHHPGERYAEDITERAAGMVRIKTATVFKTGPLLETSISNGQMKDKRRQENKRGLTR